MNQDKKEIDALLTTRLTKKGTKFKFEGRTYMVRKVSDYYLKLLEYQSP